MCTFIYTYFKTNLIFLKKKKQKKNKKKTILYECQIQYLLKKRYQSFFTKYKNKGYIPGKQFTKNVSSSCLNQSTIQPLDFSIGAVVLLHDVEKKTFLFSSFTILLFLTFSIITQFTETKHVDLPTSIVDGHFLSVGVSSCFTTRTRDTRS